MNEVFFDCDITLVDKEKVRFNIYPVPLTETHTTGMEFLLLGLRNEIPFLQLVTVQVFLV